MIEPFNFNLSIRKLAESHGFAASVLATVAGSPIYCLERRASEPKASPFRFYLSSGIHGDEPAGPLAIEAMLENESLPRDIDICILPLVNPTGFQAGTRENAQGRDLNRDFRVPSMPETRAVKAFIDSQAPFDLSISLHEDWESTGFYMYSLAPLPVEIVSRSILKTVGEIGPIEPAIEIDGYPAASGLINAIENFSLDEQPDWPETFSLYSKSPHPHFTMETPSSAPIEQRIAMHVAATLSALKLTRSTQPSAIPSE